MDKMLIDVLYIILTGSGIGVLGVLFTFVNSYIKNKQVVGIVQCIETAVMSVAQTYVDALKKEGKFDSVAQEEAKKKAIEIATDLIGVKGQTLITKLYGDFATYLDNKIEELVKKTK